MLQGRQLLFSEFSYRATVFISMTMLNVITLQMFQSKMKVSPPVLSAILTEHLKMVKKMCFICNDDRKRGGIERCEMD